MDPSPTRLTARLQISVFGENIEAEFSGPAGAVRPEKLLPVFRSLTDALVRKAGEVMERQNLSLSCQKGCAACCRKLVPISRIEARRIAELVDELAEPKRSEVRARFSAAAERLREAGLLDELRRLDQATDQECWNIGSQYFRHWITCPFLEDEACLIYSERPLACRECAVTSPPANCFPGTGSETVDRLDLPFSVSTALARAGGDPDRKRARWVPLVLAPTWAESHVDVTPPRDPLELLREVLEGL